MKECSKCHQVKAYSEFSKDRTKPDGLQTHCKSCRNQTAKSIWLKVKDTSWYINLKRQTSKNYRKKYPEREKLKSKKFHDRHPGYWKSCIAKHPLSDAQIEHNREKSRRYLREHPEKQSIYNNNKRARKRNNGGSYTVREWIELCARYGNRCLACGELKPLTADHVIPLSKGGKNSIDNIQPLCLSCNDKKSTKTIDYRVTVT